MVWRRPRRRPVSYTHLDVYKRQVLVAPGDSVTVGQALVILEAMKMENEIRAPFDGVVTAVPATVGQSAPRGQVLVEVK